MIPKETEGGGGGEWEEEEDLGPGSHGSALVKDKGGSRNFQKGVRGVRPIVKIFGDPSEAKSFTSKEVKFELK